MALDGGVKLQRATNVRAYSRFERPKAAVEEVIGARHDQDR